MDSLTGTEIMTMTCEDAAALEAWLAEHHTLAAGVWLKLAKKSSGITSVRWDEVVDVALCWGWIDGQRKGFDDTYFLQKITPRRARSKWSQVNVRKIAALTEAGRMRPPGIAEVERAKADGRWDAAYVSQKEATVPDDLAAAFAENGAARECFEGLGKTDRYRVILRLEWSTSPSMRAARLTEVIRKLAAGEKVGP
ncbi:YdeI/OmpD-associated family protein [Streptomyces sp. T-3]|nr:YdeI/OmpD-associated family protein [Streptomyces sp. T-3]